MLPLLFAMGAAAVPLEGYEERLVKWGLEQHGREVEPAPEGRVVEEILVASEDVIAQSEPWPQAVNLIHVLTKEHVVRREVLLRVGQPFRRDLAEETERNLRDLFILSVAKVVPLRGLSGGVGVLVVTRDRWSLRFNSEFNFVGPLLQYLRLRPTEQNFLGLNHQVSVDFILRLDTVALGQLYQAQRLGGTDLYFGETAALVFNRGTGALEGSTGKLVFGRPLVNLESTWAFASDVTWSARRRRIFRGATVWMLDVPGEPEPVPYVYDEQKYSGEASYTRSHGRGFKVNATVGVGAHSQTYRAPSAVSASAQAYLAEQRFPKSETAAYVLAKVRGFRAEYKVLKDLDTFSLSEDYQLGPSFNVQARYADPRWGSPLHFWEAGAAARYRIYAKDDLFTVSAGASARRSLDGAGWVNERLAFEVTNFSPPLDGGRFVQRAVLDLRRHNLDRVPTFLGGGNGLRGAPPEVQSGQNLFLFNCEYRSRPFELATLFVGLVLFADVGAAFDQGPPPLLYTTGLGLRILVPQWNQEVVRIDFGATFGAAPRSGADYWSGSFGQVTDYRPAATAAYFSDGRPTFFDQPLWP